MPLEESIVHLPGFKVERIEGMDPVEVEVRYTEPARCPECGDRHVRIKAQYFRRVRHESIGSRACYLRIRGRKYFCRSCRRYFHERYPGIRLYRRSSEGFRLEVFQKHRDGISQRILSKQNQIGHATIERWAHDYWGRKAAEIRNNPAPRVLGIDEHFFSRKHGYASTFCDLRRQRIHDVVLGRSEASLKRYLDRLPGKEKTQVVVMDLSEIYRAIVRKYFPNAKIVADRFHVIRWVNHQFLKAWQQLDPSGRKNRGLLSLMRRHEENLSEGQKITLREYLKAQGVLEAIYDFKQELCRLLRIKHQTQWECQKWIPKLLEMIEQLKAAPIEALSSLGKTLHNWREEIVRMWRFTKTNSITEGFHTKMEMISRRAFGFRNFENYRLRVRALCG
ncbi:MAG: ISL3 family transposase [Pseudomonadota bacterium]